MPLSQKLARPSCSENAVVGEQLGPCIHVPGIDGEAVARQEFANIVNLIRRRGHVTEGNRNDLAQIDRRISAK